MAIQNLQIIYALPGRIRVLLSQLKDNPAFADELQRQLARSRVARQAGGIPSQGVCW